MEMTRVISRLDEITQELKDLSEHAAINHYGQTMIIEGMTLPSSIYNTALDVEKLRTKVNDQDNILRFHKKE